MSRIELPELIEFIQLCDVVKSSRPGPKGCQLKVGTRRRGPRLLVFNNFLINIDIDILKNVLIDSDILKNIFIDINIFRIVLTDIDILKSLKFI